MDSKRKKQQASIRFDNVTLGYARHPAVHHVDAEITQASNEALQLTKSLTLCGAPSSSVEDAASAGVAQSTPAGTLALLKGEKWEGNSGRGIVHRSPAMPELGAPVDKRL